jgi:MoaA/NifB/PqqE/SkfB family radical SAM enzyme
MPWPTEFLSLGRGTVPKLLERPSLYHTGRDELYELSDDAFAFVAAAARGEVTGATPVDGDFLETCLAEGLLEFTPDPHPRSFPADPAPNPSLRYLELQVTDRCNLRCRHCYLPRGRGRDLPVPLVASLLEEFEAMQGLRLLVSGGEPLLHPRFRELNDLLRDRLFRSVLLTNGLGLDRETAGELAAAEVQVSLDGLEAGHDALRGPGTFRRAVEAIRILREAGKDVSVATMVHARNLAEFPGLAELVADLGAREWSVDVPSPAGELQRHPELQVDPSLGGCYLEFGYGGGHHGAAEGMACGSHLCAVMPDGRLGRCGFFPDDPGWPAEDGLREGWSRVRHRRLDELDCDCVQRRECRGGCRFRAAVAGDPLGPDPVQCVARGVAKGGEKDDHRQGG